MGEGGKKSLWTGRVTLMEDKQDGSMKGGELVHKWSAPEGAEPEGGREGGEVGTGQGRGARGHANEWSTVKGMTCTEA